MATSDLSDYIRKSIASGLTKPDIEKALLVAGWQPQDINAGFNSLAPADDTAAETARIQHELELEAKRQKWRGATVNTPGIGGIIGWLIAKKLAHDEVQANLILVGVAVVAIVLAVWVNWPGAQSDAPTPAQIEESIKAMQNIKP